MLCILVISLSFLKGDGLYTKYKADEENKYYKLVVVRKIDEDNIKAQYLVKLKNDNFILNIYISENFENISYEYGDELGVRGKILKSEVYGNPRRI